MPIQITDWGIEHNGLRKYDGAHIAGQGAGFKIWAIADVTRVLTNRVQLKSVAELSGATNRIYNPQDATSSATESNFCYVRGTTTRCGINYNMAPITDLPANAHVVALHFRYKVTPNGTLQPILKLYSSASHTSYAAADAASYQGWDESRATSNSTTAIERTDYVIDGSSSSVISAINADHSLITTEGKCVMGFNLTNRSSSTSTNYRQIIWFCYMWVEYE